jgi:hypothetical protein
MLPGKQRNLIDDCFSLGEKFMKKFAVLLAVLSLSAFATMPVVAEEAAAPATMEGMTGMEGGMSGMEGGMSGDAAAAPATTMEGMGGMTGMEGGMSGDAAAPAEEKKE